MPKKYGILTLLVLFSYQLTAQENTEHQNLLWTRYFLKLKVSEKWSPYFDIEERTYMFPFRQHHFIPSAGTNYKLNNNFSLSASMMYFEMVLPQDPVADEREIFRELRPQVAVNFKHSIDKHWSLLNRFKLECRYKKRPAESTYSFANYRLRMRMGVKFKFDSHWDAKILEEILINAGENVAQNVFDQNRLSAGLNYNINSNFSVETGYMYWYQQKASGVDFFSRNIVYFTLKQSLKVY
jgi:hypothetical protein